LITKVATSSLLFVKHQSETSTWGSVVVKSERNGMMRRGGHMIRPASERRPCHGYEKTVHNPCPNCGIGDLTVYFEEGSSRKVGALVIPVVWLASLLGTTFSSSEGSPRHTSEFLIRVSRN
jgi:hypothetical protein